MKAGAAVMSRSHSGRERDPTRGRGVLPTVLLALTTCYFLLPIWWLLVAATKSQGELYLHPGFWFSRMALVANLETLFGRENGVFLRWALNSGIYSFVGAGACTLISLTAGYAFAKFYLPAKERWFSVVLVGVLLPPTILTVPLFFMFSDLHLTNSYWSVLVPSMVSPFGVYLSRILADSYVPTELLEAARLDGASEVRILVSVAMPIMRPIGVTLFLFQFVGIWNNYFLPLIMLSNMNLYPATLGLVVWDSQFAQDPTLAQSVLVGSLVLLIPLLACFVALQKYLRGGLSAGSLKM